MTKSLALKIAAAVTALSVCGSVSAEDTLPTRVVEALGVAIAIQGDAALVEIRHELKDALMEQIKPYLPRDAAPPVHPDRKPAGSR